MKCEISAGMKSKWVLEQYFPRNKKLDKGKMVVYSMNKDHGMREDKSIVTDDSLDAVGSTKNTPNKVTCLFFVLTIKPIIYSIYAYILLIFY